MKVILTPYFWLSMTGEMTSVSRYVLILLLIIFVGLLGYIKFTQSVWKKTPYRKIYQSTVGFLVVNIFVGSYLWLVTEQVIPVLSVRIWFVFWLLEIIFWIRGIHKDYIKIPEKKKNNEADRNLKKYIP